MKQSQFGYSFTNQEMDLTINNKAISLNGHMRVLLPKLIL